jgi:undecaprenyl diphosphate synthase
MSNLYPKSVCIIGDGNRTYSILSRRYEHLGEHAYRSFWNKVEDLIKYILEMPYIENVFIIPTIRNNHLDPNRVEIIKPVADYLGEYMERLMPTFIDQEVQVNFIGDIDLFIKTSNDPLGVRKIIDNTVNKTKNFSNKYFYQMYAYDYYYELLKLINEIDKPVESIEELRIRYYGREIGDLDLIIRTGRPRLSRAIPLLISEYADFYIFPASFPLLNINHVEDIFGDYRNRISSKGGKFIYSDSDVQAMQEFSLEDFDTNPLVIGTKIGNVWLPISKTKH